MCCPLDQDNAVSVWKEWKAEMSPWLHQFGESAYKVYMSFIKIMSNVRNPCCKNYQVY